MNVAQLLLRTARHFPQSPAVYQGTTLLCDYESLAQRALALEAGERVAVLLPNRAEYLEVLYGIWLAGLVAVPINARLHPREVAFILADSRARVVFAAEPFASGALDGAEAATRIIVVGSREYCQLTGVTGLRTAVDRDPTDLAWLFYTSGTTGQPKGVMQTHRNLLSMTTCYFCDVDAPGHGGSTIYAAPMSHGAGLYNFVHMLVGARHVLPESGGFDPAELVELAAAHGGVSMFGAPTMINRLVNEVAASGSPADGFRTIVYGGGPMYSADITRALDVMGDRFAQIYGQGECPMTITALTRAQIADRSHPRYAERLASVGVAHSAVEVRVADPSGAPLPTDEPGEILVRGDPVMRGYWDNAAASAETLRAGWLHTGDVGSLDAHGFLTLHGRCKDVIISGGANIYPREVEQVLLLHPAVAEAAVLGRQHADWGEEVCAFVVLRPGESAPAVALDALCLAHIARFKRPRCYRFVAELPKNNNGKVLKTALREELARSSATC